MTNTVAPPPDVLLRPSDLPLPSGRLDGARALFGTPSPEIGRPLLAWSDVGVDGASLREVVSPWGGNFRETLGLQRASRSVRPGVRLGVSLLWAALFGLVGGPLLGFGLWIVGAEMIGLAVRLELLLPFGVVALGGLAFAVSYFVLWAPRFEARCVYVGTNGIEVHEVASGRAQAKRALYARTRPSVVVSRHTLRGRVLGTRELLVMGDVMLTGWSEGAPDEDTLLVREIARLGGAA